MVKNLNELLEISSARHKHVCPRQVLGVRMGMLAAKLLSLPLPQTNKRLLTIVETDGCFADGIAVSTGCELGHRTLRLIDFGKVAATFIDTAEERAIRIAAHPDSRSRATAYYESAEKSRWHGYLHAYQIMPDSALFVAQPVHLQFSLDMLISKPTHRVVCSACGEEIINQREVIIEDQVLCRGCGGQAYYTWSDQVFSDTLPAAVIGEVIS